MDDMVCNDFPVHQLKLRISLSCWSILGIDNLKGNPLVLTTDACVENEMAMN